MTAAAGTPQPDSILAQLHAYQVRSRRDFRLKFIATWVVLIGALFFGLWATGNIDLGFIAEWGPFILGGAGITILLSVVSIVLATGLAIVGAIGRTSANPYINGVASLYVSLVRGTPLIVQIFFIYFGLPQLGIVLPSIPAGIIALSFNYGAYMTEIFRAGIQAVPRGQREAAEALGMPERRVMSRIVLPQAFRIVIPAIGNDFVAMIKDSSLVSTIAVQELLWRAGQVGTQNFRIARGAADRCGRVLGHDHRVQHVPGAAGAPDGTRRPMTQDPRPDLGATAATGGSRYGEALGEVIVRTSGHREVLRRRTTSCAAWTSRSGVARRSWSSVVPDRERPRCCGASTSSRSRPWDRSRSTGSGSTPIRCTRAAGRTRSRSGRCGSAPGCSSRSSTCSRT